MKPRYPFETLIFVALLIVLNASGLFEGSALALYPNALERHEWWRWLTFAWAHLSIYHLLLDGSAFVCLYNQMRCNCPARWLHLGACIFGSGVLPVLFDGRLETIGLRGLSGAAHGLMVVTALEALTVGSAKERLFAGVILAGIGAKCVVEQFTGEMFLTRCHWGYVGLPVPLCHLGGALGGLVSFGAARLAPYLSGVRASKFRGDRLVAAR